VAFPGLALLVVRRRVRRALSLPAFALQPLLEQLLFALDLGFELLPLRLVASAKLIGRDVRRNTASLGALPAFERLLLGGVPALERLPLGFLPSDQTRVRRRRSCPRLA
jgi:hypothetical protein